MTNTAARAILAQHIKARFPFWRTKFMQWYSWRTAPSSGSSNCVYGGRVLDLEHLGDQGTAQVILQLDGVSRHPMIIGEARVAVGEDRALFTLEHGVDVCPVSLKDMGELGACLMACLILYGSWDNSTRSRCIDP